ncbi:MAG: transporter substrate-binding domain-containing protein [Coriobacteriales bacterium]|nr:transporter substrate-binding domain-containing protein [Coriobacteriales bacterium]
MRRLVYVALAMVMAICLLFPTVALSSSPVSSAIESANADAYATPQYTRLKELEGKRIGTVLGTTYDDDVQSIVPDADDFVYFSEMTEMIIALKMGRIDACCLDLPVAQIAMERNSGLAIMPQDAGLDANAVAMPKDSSLTNRVRNIVAKFVSDGTMDDLEYEWTGLPESARDTQGYESYGTKGTIVCAVDDATEPMSYRDADGELVGLEVTLAKRIAQELDMQVELVPMPFDAITTALDSNSIDMAIAGISITDERAEEYDLSPAYRSAKVVLLVRDVSNRVTNPILEFYDSLIGTFLKPEHAGMYLRGMITTLQIVVASVMLGLVVGMGMGEVSVRTLPIYHAYGIRPHGLSRGMRFTIHKAIRAVEAIVLEVPVVIVLMAAKFLVFGLRGSSGDAIAVLGLSVALAAKVSCAMREGVEAVGIDPWEAAASMGYTPRQSVSHVILPLARNHMSPAIRAAIVQTVFDSSVVGLIAVNDITRVSDLIRSRTTEALPTLLAVALTYLVMSRLLQMALDKYEERQQRRQAAKSLMR